MYDAIVLGAGGVGSAALYHLGRRGVRALGIDRFSPPHDRGSSHGQTRIIRQAYFEHPDYVPLLLRSYELWEGLTQNVSQELYREVGVLQMGPRDGVVLRGVLASARQHGLPVEELSTKEIVRRYPGFKPQEQWSGVLEKRAGYLFVERCIAAHLEAARAAGAELRTNTTVRGWKADASGVKIETDVETLEAARLIVAAGAWSRDLLLNLGIELRLRRKAQFWFRAQGDVYREDRGCPAYLFETPSGMFYGFPQLDELGVKVAEHSGGQPVADPLRLDVDVNPEDEAAIRQFCNAYLPQVSSVRTRHAPCMYTMSPDEHFIVDRHPAHANVVLAAGLSGHGFKFTSVLGLILADLALNRKTDLPIGFLSLERFGPLPS